MASIFKKQNPLEAEWKLLLKKEQKFAIERQTQKKNLINKALEGKVPDKLQDTLNMAFQKAFAILFEKATPVLEKTYNKKKAENDYKIKEYIHSLSKDKKTLKGFRKSSSGKAAVNTAMSGIAGTAMGAFGVGIPDIPVLVSFMLRSIYEIAISYGFAYEEEEEKYFILQIIRAAVSGGEMFGQLDEQLNAFAENPVLPKEYYRQQHIIWTSNALAAELLYMKFLQGIPIIGAVGGFYDTAYMKQITEYASLKYRRRFLRKQIKKMQESSK